ncbi:hypothetical protein CHARACLAT_005695 [Characodon lateralis]|uniref:Uncharacterized protein n=1 Tax=Characodon lateralis TaxID=208331 RepID=A0ABU7D4F2_9TELE|nr:hypothetical protein [Characodon lateralis]
MFLPYCVMKQEGQATERESICQPFSLLSPLHVVLPAASAHLPSQSLSVRSEYHQTSVFHNEFRSGTPSGQLLRFNIFVNFKDKFETENVGLSLRSFTLKHLCRSFSPFSFFFFWKKDATQI